MDSCARCAVPPRLAADAGTLWLAPPLAHSIGTLRALLAKAGIPSDQPDGGLMTVPLAPGRFHRLADALESGLSRIELRETRSIVVPEGRRPGFADLARMQPLATLIARARGDWFGAMLAEGRLTTHFHPIVRAADPAEVFAFECLLRGVDADGSTVSPGRLYEFARDADLLFPLDRAARLTAIREASRHGLDGENCHIFINFNPTSIYDPRSCLRSTVGAIAETRLRPERVVFEIVESDQVDDPDHLARICDFYRAERFKVAIDDLGSGYGSLNLLERLRPDFVKLDMHLIRGVDRDAYKAGVVRNLLGMARELGIGTVAEGVEREGEWHWLRDHGADFLQGYLFARPASPPPVPAVPRVAPIA